MKTNWLDRTLILSPHYALCLNEKDFHKTLKQLKILKKYWPKIDIENCGGTTYEFISEDGTPLCIVVLNTELVTDEIDRVSFLIHESVHVWQAWKNWVNELSPSAELEAYSIQTIATNLIVEYKNLTANI